MKHSDHLSETPTLPKRARLTKRLVDGLAPRERQYTVRDTELPGFAVWVSPGGRKSYAVAYRTRGGKRRSMAFARAETMPPSEARKEARQLLARVARGQDPLEEKRAGRKRGITLAALWELYEAGYLDHPRPPGRKGHRPLSPRTRDAYRWLWRKYLKPGLGRRCVDSITPEDVQALHRRIGRRSAVNANRTAALLGSMYTYAAHDGVVPRGSNPTRGLVRFEERARQRFLSTEELARLGEALRAAEDRETWQAVAAIRLLILTGCRRSEVLSMRWPDLDLERGLWNLPDSKTGARPVYLPAAAVELLAGLPRLLDCPWVLPGKNPARPFRGVAHPWERIRAAAGLEDVRLHDLRHSYASAALAGGAPLELIQALLGHHELRTTGRYAHLAADPVRQAAERAGAALAAALEGETGVGEVVPGPGTARR